MPATTAIPWRMWYDQAELRLFWPEGWGVTVCPMADAPELPDEGVAAAVAAPATGPPLRELARGRKSCCILVDDLTRPTPAARILPPILDELAAAGMADEQVFFIVAGGTHRSLTRPDLEKKIGPGPLDRFVVRRHDCHQNLVPVGEVDGIGTIRLNQFFMEADLKIGITGLAPHFIAGFSGGAKIVMPAVSGFEAIVATHAGCVTGPPVAVGVIEGNAMRRVMDETARRAGLDFLANAVFNSTGRLAGLFCGDPAGSYARAAATAREVYATDVQYGNDVAVFNAFPKDSEFIQAMVALNVWADRHSPARDVVRPGGTIVVVSAASEGIGSHQLVEHGRLQYRRRDRHGAFAGILDGRNLLFLAPGVNAATVGLYQSPEARHFAEWAPLRAALETLHPGGARVAVFPASSLQLDRALIAECLAAGGSE